MFSLIKQVFIILLSFSISLATKFLFLNDEQCLVRPTLIDLNLVNFKYYPFMVNVQEVVILYLQKYVFQKKQKP